jgi:LmbE family N-acetylglucosaminyl deacetylase
VHAFIAPHPDDAALSCGGLIAVLRECGEEAAIITVYSGASGTGGLTAYQRTALGFGTGGESDGETIAASRRVEDSRFARDADVQILWLDLPDAVYRGYEGDASIFGEVRSGDAPPVEPLRAALVSLGASRVYAPLAVGNHVDHHLCRDAAVAITTAPAELRFYEDFPYAWWSGFAGPGVAGPGRLSVLEPEYLDITGVLDRKRAWVLAYASQVPALFGGGDELEQALREYHARLAREGGLAGYAERTWVPAGVAAVPARRRAISAAPSS